MFEMKKKTECLKCHKPFTTDADSMGVPYNKICPNCKKQAKKTGKGVLAGRVGI